MVMAKRNAGGENFEPCPEGMFDAVCVDVEDLGMAKTGFKVQKGSDVDEVKPMVAFHYIVAATDDEDKPVLRNDGNPFIIRERFNNTLGGGNKTSNLCKHLESWTGKTIPEEVKDSGFDLDKMLGRGCQLVIVHRKSKDGQKTYANIKTITPARKGAPKIDTSDYIRVKDREGYDPPFGSEEWEKRNPQAAAGGKGAPPPEGGEEDDDDLPF